MKRLNDDFSISDVLKEFLKDSKLEKGLEILRVKEYWAETMGKNIANYTEDIQYNNGKVYIRLKSAALRNELDLGRSKILKLFQDQFGKSLIRDIVLR